jgi:hypothetical protein
MSYIEDMSPELERLRAAHQDVDEPDPVLLSSVRERVLAGAEPELAMVHPGPAQHAPRDHAARATRGRAGPRRRRQPLLRRMALAGIVASLLAAVSAVSLDVAPPSGRGPGLPKLDAVAQARAALLPPDAIAHYTVALSRNPEEGPADPRYADCNAGPMKVWRASDPRRWRAVQPVSDNPACGTMDLSQGMGPVIAPRFEVSYTEEQTAFYVPGRDVMLVITGHDKGVYDDSSAASMAASIQLFATPPQRSIDRREAKRAAEFVDNRPPDMISDIEQKLAAGELRDQGQTTREGRRVRVLTGETERSDGKNVFSRTRIEYVVDAETFAPVSATTTTTNTDSGATDSTTARFGDYEQIPLTRDSAKLLKIDAKPGTQVIERTIEQIKNPPPDNESK